MDHQTRVASLFDRLADDYDALGVEFFKPIAAGLVAALDPRPGEHAVDLGCGRGAALVPLCRAVAPTGSVVGIDVSRRMVALARQEIERAGVVAELRVGDAADPDLPEDSFDVVVSSLVLFFLPDALAALAAWRRLLVDGGRVGVSTFGSYDEQWRDHVDAALAAFAPAGVNDARTTGARGPFSSDVGMERLLSQAGFGEVRTLSAVLSPRFEDAEHWYRWSMSVGQRQFWEAIPAGDLDRVRDTVLAAVDRCRDGQGRIGFDQKVRFTLGVR